MSPTPIFSARGGQAWVRTSCAMSPIGSMNMSNLAVNQPLQARA